MAQPSTSTSIKSRKRILPLDSNVVGAGPSSSSKRKCKM